MHRWKCNYQPCPIFHLLHGQRDLLRGGVNDLCISMLRGEILTMSRDKWTRVFDASITFDHWFSKITKDWPKEVNKPKSNGAEDTNQVKKVFTNREMIRKKLSLDKKLSNLNRDWGQDRDLESRMVMTIQPTSPAKVPSHVFLGLILVRGVLPKACNFSIVKIKFKPVLLVKKAYCLPCHRGKQMCLWQSHHWMKSTLPRVPPSTEVDHQEKLAKSLQFLRKEDKVSRAFMFLRYKRREKKRWERACQCWAQEQLNHNEA